MSFYFSLLLLGVVLTTIGFSFLFVSLEELKEADQRKDKRLWEYVLWMVISFLDILLGTWGSISFMLLLMGLAGIGIIIYSLIEMISML